jgi:hypothetical protein
MKGVDMKRGRTFAFLPPLDKKDKKEESWRTKGGLRSLGRRNPTLRLCMPFVRRLQPQLFRNSTAEGANRARAPRDTTRDAVDVRRISCGSAQ